MNYQPSICLWDNHMHSCYSGDSEAPMQDMAEAARAHGLSGMTFTDHLDWDYSDEPHLFDLDLDGYRDAVRSIQKKYEGSGFQILYGLELGLQPHLAAKHHELLASYDFDYVIGSSHQVDGMDPYYPAYFGHFGLRGGLQRYFESILENLEAFHECDAYGHLDYIVRYVDQAYSDKAASERIRAQTESVMHDLRDLIDAVLKELIRYDIALEVNTGSYRAHLSEPHPSAAIIRRYHALGGSLITIGADAHRPEDVALGFTEEPVMYSGNHFQPLECLLKECGFSEFAVYRKRNAHMIPLKEI